MLSLQARNSDYLNYYPRIREMNNECQREDSEEYQLKSQDQLGLKPARFTDPH